ncbi:TPA: DUF2523 domain-containing protein [Acinetobacter baumannii]|uniref:DUF2523 family protein n=1 Tax=Acinetobacter baumannii TaxID=470 RepID=UPI000B543131|nr:DUF2523 family protein [Acinetobacter baumannii]MDA4921859.1 DUF2523 family protein [Acinetobacter baumannii]OWX20124.1 hypothetical protein A7A33_05245 [Acinetobacter baumannii]PRO26452.1 hypothetical protein B9W57_09735 [Acinetobacter baumannii]PRO27359.1 hypothetical protein B9W69_20725 [Acinetobacter baumannii]TLT20420.1 DUF2523 domain-containing protein [Acinetobacter baumannii]
MPAFLYTALAWFATNLLAKVLVGAGLGIYSYHLISDFSKDMLDKLVLQFNSGLSLDLIQILSLGGFVTAINCLLSALTVVVYFIAIKVVFGRTA